MSNQQVAGVGSLMQVFETCIERRHCCSPDAEVNGAVKSALALLPAGQRELVSMDIRHGTVIAARNGNRAILVFPERTLVTRKPRKGNVALRGLPQGVVFDDDGEKYTLRNEPTEILFSEGAFVAVEVRRLTPPTQNGAVRRHRAAIEAVRAAVAQKT